MPRRMPICPSTKHIRRAPLKRSTKPIKARGKPRFKGRVDEAYREYIRGLRCCVWPQWECWGHIVCAHVKARSTGGHDVGNIVPLCVMHHSSQHERGIKSFQQFYGVDLDKLAAEYGGRWQTEQEAANG